MKKQKTGTKQWAPKSENCCKGCKNDCRYCYARKSAVRFKQKTKENWHIMEFNPRCVGRMFKHKGRIMFPTSHDLHMQHVDWWFPFLEGLLAVGNDVLIVTKPECAAVMHMCNKLTQYKDKMEFRFTIGSCNDAVLKYWEPGAPSFHERVTAMAYAKYDGYRTSVSIEPMLDEDPSTLIDLILPFVTGDIWIGTMNHMTKDDFEPDEEVMYKQMLLINSFPNIAAVYHKFKDNPRIQWKDSIQRMMGLDAE